LIPFGVNEEEVVARFLDELNADGVRSGWGADSVAVGDDAERVDVVGWAGEAVSRKCEGFLDGRGRHKVRRLLEPVASVGPAKDTAVKNAKVNE